MIYDTPKSSKTLAKMKEKRYFCSTIPKDCVMTTLQLNQEVLRQVGFISSNDNLLKKVIDYIKSIAPTKKDATAESKREMLERILSMSKPCPMTEDEIKEEVNKGRQDFHATVKS